MGDAPMMATIPLIWQHLNWTLDGDWPAATVTETPVQGLIAPAGEPLDTTAQFDIYLRDQPDIARGDRLVRSATGRIYDILDGQPAHWSRPDTTVGGTKVRVVWLDERAIIRRPAGVVLDENGTKTVTWTTLAENVPVAISQRPDRQSGLIDNAGAIQAVGQLLILLNHHACRIGDVIEITDTTTLLYRGLAITVTNVISDYRIEGTVTLP